jgi:predicted dithiol-disulfide oxidoreductase (DUF899 family)
MSASTSISSPTVVVSSEEWLDARRDFLKKEKEFTRLRDELSSQRRQFPWVKVEQNYVFDGPNGKQTLNDLFDGRSQLIIYHFMFGPDWEEGCKSCSFEADHFNSIIVHLNARDISMAAISRAPIEKLLPFKRRMGWNFKWLSSFNNSFNFDYHVSFSNEDLASGKASYNFGKTPAYSDETPGLSVFCKNSAGEIFHTYSTYARGLDIFLGAYNFIDITPKGRDEDGLSHPMSWVRHHDRYAPDPPLIKQLISLGTTPTAQEKALA